MNQLHVDSQRATKASKTKGVALSQPGWRRWVQPRRGEQTARNSGAGPVRGIIILSPSTGRHVVQSVDPS